MTQTIDKPAALNELYSRVTQVAKAMGGAASVDGASRAVPGVMVATPRSEDVPALYVEMPGGFRAEFAPQYPLSVGTALSVQVKRTHAGARKNDWGFNFGPSGWQRTQTPLSDDEIQACLTPDGPPSIW